MGADHRHDHGQGVHALVFDVFGTVVDWRTGVATELRRIVGGSTDWAAFADAWRSRYAPSMDRVRRGELGWTNLDGLHRRSLDDLLTEWGLHGVGPDARRELTTAWHRLDPWPDAVAGLNRLKSRYVIGTFSNGNVALLVNMAKRAGLPWDVILSAELIGHYKPDPETYDMAPALLGVPADRVMLVAAHLDDLAAARGRGLRTGYVRRPLESGPSGPQPPVEDPDADLSVSDFGELADLMGA